MKRNVFFLWLLLALAVGLIITGYVFDLRSEPDAQPYVSNTPPHIDVSIGDKEVFLVGSVVEEWTKNETNAVELYNHYRTFGQVYAAKSAVIKWGVFDIPEGSFITSQYFELATMENFQDVEKYELRPADRSIELPRLLVDCQYYYRVTLGLDSGQQCVAEGSFKTAWSPRIIEFENLRNIRDIGGWKTQDGKVIRQEMLYRGCELDGATEEKCVAPQSVVDTMVKELKIRSELDLRSADTNGVRDILGSDVKHQYFALPSYAGSFTDESNQALKGIFSALAMEENYPVYLHCTKGTDRTGIVCYLLEALLGVPEEDCYREWELSVLDSGKDNHEAMDHFMENLRKYEGNTLQEKTENYLRFIGVTQEEINSIRSLLVA